MSLMDQLTNVLTAQVARSAAQKAGVSEGLAATLMPMAMAVLMNGLKKNAATPDGAEALARALDRHDGSLLNDARGIDRDDVVSDGEKILGHILGGKRQHTERTLAKAAGVDQAQVAKLLAMAAPAVLASLGRAKRERNLDVSGLAGLVAEEGMRAERAAPNELSGLMQFIDKDGDGNVGEEMLEMGAKMLGGLFSRNNR